MIDYSTSQYHGKDPKLQNVDLNNLEPLEYSEYKRYRNSGQNFGEALQTIINTVEGDTTQLSPALAGIARKQEKVNETPTNLRRFSVQKPVKVSSYQAKNKRPTRNHSRRKPRRRT